MRFELLHRWSIITIISEEFEDKVFERRAQRLTVDFREVGVVALVEQ